MASSLYTSQKTKRAINLSVEGCTSYFYSVRCFCCDAHQTT